MLSSSCSRLCHHPVAGALQESDGHRFASFVILHADDACFRRPSCTICLDLQSIVKLQRQCRKKNSVLRAAVLHDRCFAKAGSTSARSGDLHWYANRSCLRKEPCQLLRAALLFRYECQPAGLSHAASRPTGQDSPALPLARHTTHQAGRKLPKAEMHAVRQRTTNVRPLQVTEIVRLSIFSGCVVGSTVSP